MSLHDVDKDGINRNNPTPNADDNILDRLAHGTTQNQNSIEEAEADGLKFLERQVIAKQDGVNKAVFGFLDSSNKFGLKVAPDGLDVLTASDDELIFNSEQNVFKIVDTGTTTISVPDPFNTGTTLTETIPHGLGYKPITIVHVQIPPGSGSYILDELTPTPAMLITDAGTQGRISTIAFSSVDNDNLYLKIKNTIGTNLSSPPFGQDWTFRWYILQETAATT